MAHFTFKATSTLVKIEKIPYISFSSVARLDGILFATVNAETVVKYMSIAIDEDAVIVTANAKSQKNFIALAIGQAYDSGQPVFLDLTNMPEEDRLITSHMSMITSHSNVVITGTCFVSEVKRSNVVSMVRDILEQE